MREFWCPVQNTGLLFCGVPLLRRLKIIKVSDLFFTCSDQLPVWENILIMIAHTFSLTFCQSKNLVTLGSATNPD